MDTSRCQQVRYSNSNSGPSAIYNIVPKVYFDGVDIKSNNSFDILMPFQTYKTYIDIPFSFLATKPQKS